MPCVNGIRGAVGLFVAMVQKSEYVVAFVTMLHLYMTVVVIVKRHHASTIVTMADIHLGTHAPARTTITVTVVNIVSSILFNIV